MASRASGFAKKPATAKATRTAELKPVKTLAKSQSPPIPLNLLPLLVPYKKQGRLSLRIERVPQLARLSRGRNNGNGSWSLALDELEELEYQPPDGVSALADLAIRVIGLDQDGATLAVLDLANSLSAAALEPLHPGDPRVAARLQELTAALERTKGLLAKRDTELAIANQSISEAEIVSKGLISSSELDAARASWHRETQDQLLEAAKDTSAEFEIQRKEWKAQEVLRIAALESAWQEKLAETVAQTLARTQTRSAESEVELRRIHAALQAAQASKAEIERTLAKDRAEHAHKLALAEHKTSASTEQERTTEAKRLAEAEAQWRASAGDALSRAEQVWKENTAKQLADAQAQWRASAADALSRAEQVWKENTAKQLADAQAQWRASSAEASSTAEQSWKANAAKQLTDAQAQWRASSADALSMAEQAWKSAEASRLGEVEAQWREKLANATPQVPGPDKLAETALSQLRTELQAAKSLLNQARLEHATALARVRSDASQALLSAQATWKAEETKHLEEAEARWQAKIESAVITGSERSRIELETSKSELIAARRELEQLRERIPREIETALASAESTFKAGEAARLAAAEVQWRQDSAKILADAAARCERAEASLAEARTRASLSSAPANTLEQHVLQDEVSALKLKLAERETILEQARSVEVDARTRARLEFEAALAKAEATWKADEAGRFASKEAEWQSALDLAHAKYDAAEASLVQMRSRQEMARNSADSPYSDRMRDEIAMLQKSLADREVKLAHLRSVVDGQHDTVRPRETIERPSRRRSRQPTPEDQERSYARRSLAVDAFIAMLFVGALVLAWPFVLPLLPNDVQWYIYQTATSLEGSVNTPQTPATTVAPRHALTPQAVHVSAVLSHGANVRASPSGSAAIVLTLKRGDSVQPGVQSGNWTQVQVAGKTGWVFSSYVDKSPPTKTAP